MNTYQLEAHFGGRYIGNPYWIEMYRYIEITKLSGMNRARASQNRRKALEEYLRSIGMTLEQFHELEEKARKPFHTDGDGKIIIPVERVLSFLVSVCDEARSAMRPCPKEQVRSRFEVTDWTTEKTASDGVWSRFVTVSSGTGAKLSNQRGLREDHYIENFTARGQISCDPKFVNVATLQNAIEWGGQFIGIGAARKMGMGRFTLVKFAQVPRAAVLEAA